jgi:molecular chaperone DnaK (HSP70)
MVQRQLSMQQAQQGSGSEGSCNPDKSQKKVEEKVIVYDLCGFNFYFNLLEIVDGTFEVLSTDGNEFLVRDDFDNTIIECLDENFK